MFGKKVYGLDFGTKELKIYQKGKGLVVSEKNVIAIENKKRIIAIGDEAFDMNEKAPENVDIVFPVKNGVIADINYMEGLFSSFMKQINYGRKISSADYVVAVPTDITDVEKRAFTELILNSIAKVHSIKIVEKPVAAALGANLDIHNAHGVLMIDIGAETTEISVLSLGGIVISKLLPIGGSTFDEAIASNVRKTSNLYVGLKTAENLKINLANAYSSGEEALSIYGRDVVSGLPINKEISTRLVYESIFEYLGTIIDNIRMILERTPPEISSDIIDTGIFLTGGSAYIKNLDKLISKETDLSVNLVDYPQNTVANGLGRIIEKDLFDKICTDIKKK